LADDAFEVGEVGIRMAAGNCVAVVDVGSGKGAVSDVKRLEETDGCGLMPGTQLSLLALRRA
jgi:hypothetical protein